MLLAAFLDMGQALEPLLGFLQSLDLGQWEFAHRQVTKLGVEAQWCDFKISDQNQSGPWSDIVSNRQLLAICAKLPPAMKQKAELALSNLIQAEASSSATRPAAAAIDLCLDLFGFLYCWSQLDYCPIWVSPLPLGQGLCRYHGQLWPNPSPVVTRLLQGFPQHRLPIQQETITATGAAILASFSKPISTQAVVVNHHGYGAGQSDFPMSNVVRLSKISLPETQESNQQLVQLECDLDDMTGEQLALLPDRLIASGALDAQLLSFIGKKARPGYRLSCLLPETLTEQLGKTIFQHTSTLGYRWYPVNRTVLERRIETVETPWGPLQSKIATDPNGQTRSKWEHADLESLAAKLGLSQLELLEKLKKH